jgi:hypothetical protein
MLGLGITLQVFTFVEVISSSIPSGMVTSFLLVYLASSIATILYYLSYMFATLGIETPVAQQRQQPYAVGGYDGRGGPGGGGDYYGGYDNRGGPGAGPGWGSASASYGRGGMPPEMYETKSIGVCILLAFLTGGIYYIIWLYSICKRIKLLAGESPECGGELCLMIFVPFYAYYWMYTRSKKLCDAAYRHGVRLNDNSAVNLILMLFGLGMISTALMQNDLNIVARTA